MSEKQKHLEEESHLPERLPSAACKKKQFKTRGDGIPSPLHPYHSPVTTSLHSKHRGADCHRRSPSKKK